MGFNTTVVLCNDAMYDIAEDENFGKRLVDHWSALEPYGPQIFEGVEIVEQHHADHLVVVAVGGNTARVLGWGGSSRDSISEVDILRILAQQWGYVLHKEPERDPDGKFKKKEKA